MANCSWVNKLSSMDATIAPTISTFKVLPKLEECFDKKVVIEGCYIDQNDFLY